MIQAVKIPTKSFFQQAFEDLTIAKERKAILQAISNTIVKSISQEHKVNLNFICTHNSRRSQFAQVWAHFAIQYFEIPHCQSFSGGTEATAFFRNTVKSLQEVSFNFQLEEFSHRNPTYKIDFENCKTPIIGFSKTYDHSINESPFIAITTCNNADENCPFIPKATDRFHLAFNDPKAFDSSLNKSEKYLETSKQIAGEIYYIFDRVKKSI